MLCFVALRAIRVCLGAGLVLVAVYSARIGTVPRQRYRVVDALVEHLDWTDVLVCFLLLWRIAAHFESGVYLWTRVLCIGCSCVLMPLFAFVPSQYLAALFERVFAFVKAGRRKYRR